MTQGNQIFSFFGTDEGQVKEKAHALATKLTPADNPDFGLEIIEGTAETAERAVNLIHSTIAALQTIPFFGGDKVVWLKSANFFGDTITGRASSTQRAVEKLVDVLEAGLGDGVTFIVSGSEFDKRRAAPKRLSKLGQFKTCNVLDSSSRRWEEDIKNLTRDYATRLGFSFEADALNLFILLCAENSNQLNSELQKLALFIYPEKIAREKDVAQVISKTRAGIIFAIGDALAERNLPRTIALIDEQLARGESAIGILLAAIVTRVRNLLLIKDLVSRHGIQARGATDLSERLKELPPSATDHLPRKKDGTFSTYPLFVALRGSRHFTILELQRALQECLVANERLVSTSMEPVTVLNQLVTRILSKPS